MTQEDKQLLLKDLCARLPYGVIVNTSRGDSKLWSIEICENEQYICLTNIGSELIDHVKPHLRPVSSMTEEELQYTESHILTCDTESDFYLSHHIDYRGLIEKGLALEAPEGMYKTE